MDKKTTRILLIRHGETAWNQVEHFRGRADVPLNEHGLAQAAATGQRVARQWQPAAVYASPLGRARQTGEAVARHLGLAVEPVEGLIDIDYGAWQGLTPEEARRRWPEEVENWYQHPEIARIPGGEPLAAVRRRGLEAVRGLAARHLGKTIALVGHTVINRAILLGVLGLGNERFWRIRQDTCAINVFEVEEDDFVLVTLNDTCHLQG